ncbi:O-methyltransferase [Xylariomycetidae sp. FL0641]|nr:O-methyltransferase [Xylariomycetidae sp. FL0641]
MKAGSTLLYATEKLGEHITEYSEEHSLALPQALREYHAKVISEMPITSEYMISTFQSQAMVWLARLMGAKRVLEIGVFVGYSAMVWSFATGPDGKVTGLEFDAGYAAKAEAAFAQHGVKNCEVLVGDALQTLPTLQPAEAYDVIFVDAQKSGYPGYLRGILAASRAGATHRLLRPGGVVVADNALRRGLVACATGDNPWHETEAGMASAYWKPEDIARLREFNDLVRDEPRLESFVLPLWDGLTMARLLD